MQRGRTVATGAAFLLLAGCTSTSAMPRTTAPAGSVSRSSDHQTQANAGQRAPSSASTGSASPPQTTKTSPAPAPTDPLANDQLWVNPNSPAAHEVSTRAREGKDVDVTQLKKISTQPTAVWLGSWQALDQLPEILSDAGAQSATPVFVAYFIPDRDCGGSSAGGATNDSDYRNWIGTLSHDLLGHRAIIVLEPDAVPMSSPGGCASSIFADRAGLLSAAIHKLKSNAQVSVYLDAGHPAWPSDPTLSVAPLGASGLGGADGFALNTSNFQSTTDDLRYGDALSALVGGKHFIVDTGRNGAGPLPDDSGYKGPSWCNPPGRALGHRPTTQTGDPRADAFLWIKYPGESDGSCGLNDLAAGSWLPDYAIGLARRSKD